jgi:MscS family membrane protein
MNTWDRLGSAFSPLVLLLTLTLGSVAPAQTASAAGSGGQVPSAAPTAASATNRQTPRATMAGFLEATLRGDYAAAAEYLDLRRIAEEVRAQEGPVLARELRIVLDQALPIDLDSVSDQPDGSRRPDQPANRELIGTIKAKTGTSPLVLQRVTGADGAQVWKIAASTVAQIPRLYRELGYGPLGDYLPPPFFEIRFLDLALWQWAALIVLVAVASAVAWLATVNIRRALRAVARRAGAGLGDRLVTAVVAAPVRLGIALVVFVIGCAFLGLSIPARELLGDLEKALTIVIVAWIVIRMLDVLAGVAMEHLTRQGRPAAVAVVPLGRKATKVVAIGLAALAVLQNVGVNVTGILAGLGIGGLAVALAAQKTVENLFGGITLILDQPVRVGDFCRFGDKIGTIEEVGLRSTRVRTLDRTVVSVPNGQFSALQLENFTERDRIWLHTTLGLRYETTPDQLRHVLVEVRRMLYAHPRVDRQPARIRFVSFGSYSLDLEIFAYVLTTDYDDFLAVQEDIYLRIMDIVADSGTGFAFPSQTTYLARDGGLDEAKARAAEAQVRDWRAQGRLYLPEFPAEAVDSLDDTLDYPPRGAAIVTPS